MDDFTDKIAVITGAGDGMGRALAWQLSAAGCHLALCDLFADPLAATKDLCDAEAPDGTRVTTHLCDVSDEAQVVRFADEVQAAHGTDHVNLVFNNAGIGGAGSMFADDRDAWERTFNVCWYGVYYTTRAFLPLLAASEEGHLVNTSSVNGFWASVGPEVSHTAYSAAKFAVKGFTEALITDLRLNAPHVSCSVVMPGHIGTGIAQNSWAVHGNEADPAVLERGAQFRNSAPTTADEAAAIILEGVKAERWRILVGEDAYALDEAVRADPEEAYDVDFRDRLAPHFTGLRR
ncbi:MAG: SDR family NAD(P)-dependent oxidoreductase [Acidimicrobiia bacterium]|nr:SDR family NAD(P)-dependent oxidoreductase [Acidimicrobiia bacterium]